MIGRRVVLGVLAALSLGAPLLYALPAYATPLAPAPSAPPPQIIGTAQISVALSAISGAWLNAPTSFSYQWLRCDTYGNSCAAIGGATSSSYTPVNADYQETLRVQVTASNAGGKSTVISSQTAPVLIAPPVNFGQPSISGVDGQGQLLTTLDGTWNYTPTSFAFQWQQCSATGTGCSDIENATNGDYVPQSGDVGHELRVIVTAINAGGATPAASAPTLPISTMPINLAAPALSGTAQQGQTLSTSDGTWSGTPAPALSYQWERCDGSGANCAPIAGASSDEYVPVAADVGSTIVAEVIATNAAGTVTAASVASAAIAAIPVATPPAPAPSSSPAITTSSSPPPRSLATTSQPPASSAKPVITGTVRLAPPLLGKSADVSPTGGTVFVELPQSAAFTPLTKATNVPFGSTIDTRAGGVTLTAALPKGATQTGRFSGGEFVLTQTSGGIVTLALAGGSFSPCPAPPRAGSASAASVPRALATAVIRELFGNAKGKFVTEGRYASTAVTASDWMTADRCDGTYAAVMTGSAIVVASVSPHAKHDVTRGRHVVVHGPGY
ncbi:MAG TPA: hypothetical protein VHX66_10615 [Solirubrobacteraceae bacterium]|nr:hypothetical protein [Solirubrobacteraceae bacterium]